jgi:acyl-coenzyme A synthetase/AMP-(fatty) acid ligase
MSAVVDPGRARGEQKRLPLLAVDDFARAFSWRDGREISAGEFLADVFALAERLPDARHALNLCEQRYDFLVAFCAAIVAGQTNLLPVARAPQAIDDVLRAYPNAYALGDTSPTLPAHLRYVHVPDAIGGTGDAFFSNLSIPADHVVAIGFTSGSTGTPKANVKTWGSVCASSALNAEALAAVADAPQILATVPPQHMYGLELSVLLPLRSRAAVHASQPLFPAEIAAALADLSAPRVLVTTPFHLRTLLDSGVELPPLAGIVTATAPLSAELAAETERRYATQVLELFGSTETCVIAQRRTAHDEVWSLYDGVETQPQPDGTLVTAPHFIEPTLLQDIVELLPGRRFRLCGRNNDLLEIAGKRASLGDLTRRLLAIPGVEDGVIFQLGEEAGTGVRRLAALAVAPQRSEAEILGALRASIDPVFLPRPLRLVAALPRNATGKLPRAELLAALKR